MKKSFCGLPMLMLTCVLTIAGAMNVQAGEINANEAKLVSAASGTFTYEGKTYHASSQYIGELRAYLSKDDVDLTAADVSSLISDMNANIAASYGGCDLHYCSYSLPWGVCALPLWGGGAVGGGTAVGVEACEQVGAVETAQ